MVLLFDTGLIGTLELKNRIVRSATWEGMCDQNGRPTEKLVEYYKTLTEGGIGLIISGYTYIRPEGKQMPGKMGLYNDSFKEDFIRLTRTVHDAGGKIAIQLVHAGGQANEQNSGKRAVAPSAVKTDAFPQVPAELTIPEIESIADAFSQAARRAMKWGFDQRFPF